MRLLIAILLAVSPALAQVTVSGKTTFTGNNQLRGSSQNTHIWAFNPPPYSSSMTSDYYYFTHAVMPLSVIDGVSVLEEWAKIETTSPTTTPCTPSDTCQPDLGAPGYYHTYTNWSSFDNSGTATGIEQWFGPFTGRAYEPRVNILISPAEPSATNPDTPPYVTQAWWAAAFPSGGMGYNRQDVVNYALASCSEWTGTAIPGSATVMYTSMLGTVTVSGWMGQPFSVGIRFTAMVFPPVGHRQWVGQPFREWG